MVKTYGLVALALLAAGCADRYAEPIRHSPHGAAVRANMMAQIIDPVPSPRREQTTDGARTALAINAYRTGEVADPLDTRASPDTLETSGVE